jgi:hypothetical protein
MTLTAKRSKDIDWLAKRWLETLKRCRPSMSNSLRKMLVEIIRESLKWGYRGDNVIYPGMEKLAIWGECCEKTARTNMRALENWNVVEPVKYAKGGRNATRYCVDPTQIIKVAMTLGANPASKLMTATRDHVEAIYSSSSSPRSVKTNQDLEMEPVTNPVILTRINPVTNPVTLPPVLKEGGASRRRASSQKYQRQLQVVGSPYQEIATIPFAQSKRMVLSLDRGRIPFDAGHTSDCERQTAQQPDRSSDGSSAAAAYMRGIRLEARRRKLQYAELQRIYCGVADVWSDYAATDDLNDPRAWA